MHIIVKPETKTNTAPPTRSFYSCQSDKDFRKQNVYWTLFIKTCCVCFGPSGSGTTRIDDLDRCVIYYNQSNITCSLFSVLFLSSNSIRCCWLAIYLYSENIHAKLCTHILLSSSIVTLSLMIIIIIKINNNFVFHLSVKTKFWVSRFFGGRILASFSLRKQLSWHPIRGSRLCDSQCLRLRITAC